MKTQHIRATASSPAPPEAVWALAGTVATWTTWAPFQVAELERSARPDPDGIGAIRRFRKGRAETREEITEYRPGQVLAYRLLSGLPLTDYRARLELTPEDGGTRIDWSADFGAWFPGTGWLFRWGMTRLYRDFAHRLATAAAVEEGAPR